MKQFHLRSALALMAFAFASPAMSDDLRIGIKSEPTSLDPLYHVIATNAQVSFAQFEPLVMMDATLNVTPKLAESWTVDGTDWVFTLRDGVKFSDGSPFTAEDVVFTFNRIPLVPNTPTAYTLFTRQIEAVEALDAKTVLIRTRTPYPLLLTDIANIVIMSHAAASGEAPEGRTTQELNRGEGLVGTGPFRFVSWQSGAELVLERNDAYWGEKPEWDRVVYQPMTNPAARAAALLAGDIDMMEDPPTADMPNFRANSELTMAEGPESRVIYLAMDQQNVPSPNITSTQENPLMDVRVREALSLAIDRKVIVDRVMNGVAVPAGDLMPSNMFGASPERATAPVADLARAKELLAEAGYPDGFDIVLGTPNGRYVNDSRIAQTIAAMWARAGLKASVDALAPPVFFKTRDAFEFSAYIAGWGNSTGEALTTLRALAGTRNKAAGVGSSNGGRYSNPELDALLDQASEEMNEDARRAILEKANNLVLSDFGILPIHFEVPVWALRAPLVYEARADQFTLPQYVRSAK